MVGFRCSWVFWIGGVVGYLASGLGLGDCMYYWCLVDLDLLFWSGGFWFGCLIVCCNMACVGFAAGWFVFGVGWVVGLVVGIIVYWRFGVRRLAGWVWVCRRGVGFGA